MLLPAIDQSQAEKKSYRIAHSSNLLLELAFKPPLLPTLTRLPTTTSSSKSVGSINTRTSAATFAPTVTASIAELVVRAVVLLVKTPTVVTLLPVVGVAVPPLVAVALPRSSSPSYLPFRFQPYTLRCRSISPTPHR
jgi:hypothetical protein